MVRNQQTLVTDPDSQRIHMESRSRIKYYDCFNQMQVIPIDRQFRYPLEPDYNDLQLWYRFDQTGNQLDDRSLFDNHAQIIGDPKCVEGLSYGLFGGNIALQLDGENDYFLAPEGNIGAGRIAELSTGFAICTVIYPHSLLSLTGGSPSLFQKVDENDGTWGYMGKIQDDGKIFFSVTVDGAGTTKETTTSPLGTPSGGGGPFDFLEDDYHPTDFHAGPQNFLLNEDWYIIWFLSDMDSPPNLEIYVDNAQMTLQNSSLSDALPQTDIHDTIIGAGTGGGTGHYNGIYQDYRFMKRPVTPTEIGNHYDNKISISDIAYGEVFAIGGSVWV